MEYDFGYFRESVQYGLKEISGRAALTKRVSVVHYGSVSQLL